MKRVRIIPVLLLQDDRLVKSVRFRNHKYVGDPINAMKIFNDKEVDELAVIDITATQKKRKPNIGRIRELAGEAFMPLSYGGGITSVEEAREILHNGIEKIIINKSAVVNPSLITEIAERFGSQSVVVSIDYKKNVWGKPKVFTDNGTTNTGLDVVSFARECESRGAGEILLTSIERDGTYAGFDTDMIDGVASALPIPVIACGGAGSIEDFRAAISKGHASAVAAGSMFVFQRPHNAVLISYPSIAELKETLYKHL
ncbi:MAG: imidazole glycerol phosphate synthase subunit HisF [Bacteroidetes bacterium]|nr:imidazole glycerol phosphate synthase subunit HisF [Bacteroidota bacterium]